MISVWQIFGCQFYHFTSIRWIGSSAFYSAWIRSIYFEITALLSFYQFNRAQFSLHHRNESHLISLIIIKAISLDHTEFVHFSLFLSHMHIFSVCFLVLRGLEYSARQRLIYLRCGYTKTNVVEWFSSRNVVHNSQCTRSSQIYGIVEVWKKKRINAIFSTFHCELIGSEICWNFCKTKFKKFHPKM